MRPDETITYSPNGGPSPAGASTSVGEAEGELEADGALAAERLRGEVFANRFEVVRQLGEGGMGQVFRVHDRQIEGREIALKILHPRFSEDPRFRGLFFQEVRAGQSFVSEHVVQVRDTGQMDDGRLFLTMDMVEGENLSALLKREHSLDARHALEIARQTLLGMKSGHEKGFIHRDIKPSNLMLRARVPKTERNPFGVHVLILDFGLANLAKELKSGHVAGTPFYMSPEQVRDERLDARSDLFAVAVVLYEMISGSRPFQGATMHEVTSSVIETDVAPMIASLEHLSPAIQKILERALQKDREQRFQSAGEFIEAIERSKAYRLPTRIAPWLMVVTLGGTALAGVEAVFLTQKENEVGRLQDELFQQRNVISQKQQQIDDRNRDLAHLQSEHTAALTEKDKGIQQKQSELNAAQTSYLESVATKDQEIARLTKQLADATARAESQMVKGQAGDTQADALLAQLQTAQAERAEQAAQLQQVEQRLNHQTDEIERLKKRNEELSFQTQPEAVRSRGFDTLLRLIRDQLGQQAWQNQQELARDGFLAKGDGKGGDFVEAVVIAARELALFDDPEAAGNSGGSAHLVEAQRALREAEAQFDVLGKVASDWLGHATLDGEKPDRLAEARATLDLLDANVKRRLELAEGEHAGATAELLARPALDGPEALLRHLEPHGCDHAAPVIARAAGAFLAELVGADGRLDAKKLRAAAPLDAWGAALEGGRLPAESDAARALLGLWLARGWYGKGEALGTSALHERVLGTLDAAPGPGDLWRSILALEIAFDAYLQAAPDQLPTHGSHGFALYRRREGAATKWFKESAKPEGDGWTLERALLSLDPLKPNVDTPSKVRHPAKRLYDFVGWSLDLGATGPNVAAEVWTLPAEPLASGLETVLDQKTLAAFQAEEGSPGHLCLVIEDKGIRRWFSPHLGLVRVEQAGTFLSELVYTDAKRN